jgi:amino acid transporter
MWTYDGWADASFIGGEVKDPQRTMPLALTIGTVLVVIVYLIINLGFIHMLPIPEMANASLIATKVAERIPAFGIYGAAIIAALVVVSTFSGLNGSMMAGPRIFFAMADRHLFFKTVARVSPRFQSPSVAIWLATGLGVLYALQNDFAQLADKFVLGVWPFYALAVAAVFVLRKTRPDMPRPYKTWGYPIIPLLFLVASFGMVLNALWTHPTDTGITFGIMLAGIPVYYVWMRKRAPTP